MAARKLQQEVDKCFKKVAEGVAEFEAIYEKIEQSNNPAQKEKLEDNLKREIKKLQRLRDQIKTWAASNDIKDKAPLLDHRKLIETQMERFKAVEKAMKTKAYSKEGLSAQAKLDPKEQAKVESSEFLAGMVDELEQQIEALEAESESIQATMKKGKANTVKADRIAAIEHIIERHKWHQSKMELIRRSLENGGVESEQVTDLEESIRYYVSDGMNDDFIEDEELYDDLELQEDEEVFGFNAEGDRVSSQDTQSIQDDTPETEPRPITNGSSAGASIKPAPLPTRLAGEGLKYASAAAAAADKNNLGIAPLPPPPGSLPVVPSTGVSPLPGVRTSATSSPSIASIQPAPSESRPSAPSSITDSRTSEPIPAVAAVAKKEKAASKAAGKSPAQPVSQSKAPQTNGTSNGVKPDDQEDEEESIYHLPASLSDLLDSFNVTRKRELPVSSQAHLRMMHASQTSTPDLVDADAPRKYRPENLHSSLSQYPQEPLAIFDDPRLYSRIDPDTLFYVFYYKQGTYQQYLAAKALKDQSWRFHKQYQTWFQRHEEPKSITEEFEQGTYRFFDYESTWMNRRKADFKFAYRYLEDEV
ncbi:hypothetical protein PG989_014590 [Apiospora arundinis]